uniref:Uncharacterized protein n=1 Tax=Solanum lycopersicum TaxID=4081 RepID=A0A3Q7ID89_SOLLC
MEQQSEIQLDISDSMNTQETKLPKRSLGHARMVFYQEKYNKASTFGERVGNVKSICAEISGIHPEEKIKEPCKIAQDFVNYDNNNKRGGWIVYAESLLEGFDMRESKEKTTPMELNLKLKKDIGQSLKDAVKFQQLFGIYAHPITSHLDAAKRILRYVKESLSHGLWYKSTGSAVVSWCNKKQDVVLSTTEAEYISATMAGQRVYFPENIARRHVPKSRL